MAFAFDILPRFKKQQPRMFPANCRGGKPAPNWSGAYITPRGWHRVFGRSRAKWRVPTSKPAARRRRRRRGTRSSTWIGFDGQRRYYSCEPSRRLARRAYDPGTGVPTRSYFGRRRRSWVRRTTWARRYPSGSLHRRFMPSDRIHVLRAGLRGRPQAGVSVPDHERHHRPAPVHFSSRAPRRPPTWHRGTLRGSRERRRNG